MPRAGPSPSITQRLACFLAEATVPPGAQRQARRLLLSGLAASAAGCDHPDVGRLRAWAGCEASDGPASVLWHGDRPAGDRAALVNGTMMEVLDFGETHIDAFVHPTAPVWPAIQAAAESVGASLAQALAAAALGIEVELAIATMLMPDHYDRGFNPAVAAGAVGAAAGCSVVLRLDSPQTADALALAAMSGGGMLEALGTPAHSFKVGDAARSGLVAAQLAMRGFVAPARAVEGTHGMLAAMARLDAPRASGVLDLMQERWRITGNVAFKRYPAETISQAPLDCVLALWRRTPRERRPHLRAMTFRVAPLVESVCRERRRRFAVPQDDQQARFDGSFCAAAAWIKGRFTNEDLGAPVRGRADVLALRESVRFEADESLGLDGAHLTATFVDGGREEVSVPAFRGSSANPMSDEEITGKFLECAVPVVGPQQAEAVAEAVWGVGAELPMGEFSEMLSRRPGVSPRRPRSTG